MSYQINRLETLTILSVCDYYQVVIEHSPTDKHYPLFTTTDVIEAEHFFNKIVEAYESVVY